MITEKNKKYIKDYLLNVENEYKIKILLAVESGSRAWGFESEDSDYDVRFIYSRDIKSYVSLFEKGDVIEKPLEHDNYLGNFLDCSGWDIKKYLSLLIKSNSGAIEYMKSDIVYTADTRFREDIMKISKYCSNAKSLYFHYKSVCNKKLKLIAENKNPDKNLKYFLYAIRACLCCLFLYHYRDPIPMPININKLNNILSSYLYTGADKDINNLLSIKNASEKCKGFDVNMIKKSYSKLIDLMDSLESMDKKIIESNKQNDLNKDFYQFCDGVFSRHTLGRWLEERDMV